MMLGPNTDSNAKRLAVVNADRLARKRRAPLRRYYTPQDLMSSRQREGVPLDKETCSTDTSSRSGFKISRKQLTFGLSVIALTLMFILCGLTELDTLDGERRRLPSSECSSSECSASRGYECSPDFDGDEPQLPDSTPELQDSLDYLRRQPSLSLPVIGDADARLARDFCAMLVDYIIKDPNKEGLDAIYRAQFPVNPKCSPEEAAKKFKLYWELETNNFIEQQGDSPESGSEDCRAHIAKKIYTTVLNILFDKFVSGIGKSKFQKESTKLLKDTIINETRKLFNKEMNDVVGAFFRKDLIVLDTPERYEKMVRKMTNVVKRLALQPRESSDSESVDYECETNEVSPTKTCPNCNNAKILENNAKIVYEQKSFITKEFTSVDVTDDAPETRTAKELWRTAAKKLLPETCETCNKAGVIPGKYAKFGYFFRVLNDRVVILQSLIQDIDNLTDDAQKMISLKLNYAAVHGQFLEKHYGSELYKASDKSVVVEKLQKYTINFKNGVMNTDATNTSGYVFLKLDDRSELELYTTKLDKTPTKTEDGQTCQPIAEDKRGDFQFIYTEIAKVIPYLNHLMKQFAKIQNERMELDIVRFDGTNVTTDTIDLTNKIEVQTAPPKSQVRIFEKTGIKYNYDFRRVLDEARGSLICQDMNEVNGVYFTFAKFLEDRGCRILRVKNRFLQTCGNSEYADILFNVEINDTEDTPLEFKDTFLSGTIAEVQIHIKAFKIIKKQNHKVYAKFRAIPGSAQAVAEIARKDKNIDKQLKKKQEETLKLLRQETAILPAEIDGIEKRLNRMGENALQELNLEDTENDPDFEQ